MINKDYLQLKVNRVAKAMENENSYCYKGIESEMYEQKKYRKENAIKQEWTKHAEFVHSFVSGCGQKRNKFCQTQSPKIKDNLYFWLFLLAIAAQRSAKIIPFLSALL